MIWTRTIVRERLEDAVDVLDRLWVALGPQGIRPSWPDIVRTSIESYGYNTAREPKAPPHGREIDLMDEALGWLAWLDERDQQVVWARLNGAAWWRVAQRFGKSESAVRVWFGKAVDLITFQLNAADETPAKPGGSENRQKKCTSTNVHVDRIAQFRV